MNFLLTFAIFFFQFQLTLKKKKKKEKERNKIVIDNQNKKTQFCVAFITSLHKGKTTEAD
jgi:hypothetical protein